MNQVVLAVRRTASGPHLQKIAPDMNQKRLQSNSRSHSRAASGCEAGVRPGPISTRSTPMAVNRYGNGSRGFMGLIGRIEDQQRGKDAISQAMMESLISHFS